MLDLVPPTPLRWDSEMWLLVDEGRIQRVWSLVPQSQEQNAFTSLRPLPYGCSAHANNAHWREGGHIGDVTAISGRNLQTYDQPIVKW